MTVAFLQDKADIAAWLAQYCTIEGSYLIAEDGSVSIDGDCDFLVDMHLHFLEVRFTTVSGCFELSGNPLLSLQGCPEHVGGDFSCNTALLPNLKGAPRTVGGDFHCNQCEFLSSLQDGPITVGGVYDCSECHNLKSLRGVPREVTTFICCHCSELKSLEHSPDLVSEDFNCSCCTRLKTLEGAPRIVGVDMDCSGCRNLETLLGAPAQIGSWLRFDGADNLRMWEHPPFGSRHLAFRETTEVPSAAVVRQFIQRRTKIHPFSDTPALWIQLVNAYYDSGDLLTAMVDFEALYGEAFNVILAPDPISAESISL